MRILHISKYYYPYIGGVENICKYLVDGMPEYERAVVCFNEAKYDAEDMVEGVKVYRVGSKINISCQALSWTYFKVLKKALKEFKPDIIQFHWANPFPAAVLLSMIPKNVKLVIHWHMDIIKQKKIYPLIKPFETTLLKHADMVFVTSPQYREGSKPLQPFKGKVKVVPNCIETSTLELREGDEQKIAELKAKYGGKKIVFFVGRHIQYKGLPYLIEAEKKITGDCVVVIAGKGPLTPELKAECHSDRVHFVGKVSDDELRWYHHAASIFAFPSITKNEAFGVALAEAMYCNTPAVTFTIAGSGVNWVCSNGTCGLEAPNCDSAAYAANIDKLLSNEKMAKRFGENGHKRVMDKFLIKNMVDAAKKGYKEIMEMKMENQAFIEFLRFSMGLGSYEASFFHDMDWQGLYDFGKKQSLLGVLFIGVQRFKSEISNQGNCEIETSDRAIEGCCNGGTLSLNNPIPQLLLLKWIGIANKISDCNKLVNKRCAQISELLKINGFENCLLKGQGTALYYPKPDSRNPGDIDIWVEGNRKMLLKNLGRKYKLGRQGWHHTPVDIFKDVEVEVHHHPMWLANPISAHRLNKYFSNQWPVVSKNDSYIGFSCPTNTFAAIYGAIHIFHHFLEEGVGLKQFMDLYYILLSLDDENRAEVMLRLKSFGLAKFTAGMMYVLENFFLLNDEYQLCSPNAALGRFIEREIVQSGNFGRYDERNNALEGTNRISRFTKNFFGRQIKYLYYFPNEVLWILPCRLWQFFIWKPLNHVRAYRA